MTKILDTNLFHLIAKEAVDNPQKRKNYDLRDSANETGQRMLNILLPGSKTPIHRHANTSEVVVCIYGSATECIYGEDGSLIESIKITAGSDIPGIIIGINEFHSLEATDEMGVVLSYKAGIYEPIKPEDILYSGNFPMNPN